MNFQKDTIRTSVLTLLTFGLVAFTILLVGVPGFFNRQYEISIYFDNASGIQQGANVMVAGRKVGFVSAIDSPLAPDERPKDHPECEVRIYAKINDGNQIYQDSTAVMLQQGLLGSMVIDFVRGSPEAGFAENGTEYLGERRPDFTEAIPALLDAIRPVAESAEEALSELKTAAERLESLLGENGPMATALIQIRELADNLGAITARDGALTVTLERFGVFAEDLSSKEGALQKTFSNLETFTAQLSEGEQVSRTLTRIEEAANQLDTTLSDVQGAIGSLEPTLGRTLVNTEEMTDTLKRQPWRLIWPSTVEYPSDAAEPTAPPAPTPTPKRSWPRGPLK